MAALFLNIAALAQGEHHNITGNVVTIKDNVTTEVPGAFIHWMDKKSGVFANDSGQFSIPHMGERPYLVVSYVTYKTDTIHITDMSKSYTFTLLSENEIGAALVLGRRITYGLSRLSPRTTVLLSEREFQKAACCNLSESFENAPAIDVSFSDAVTGTKQIKMLGLDGFYTLIGREYMPAVRTINSYYGLSLMPAAWVEGIQITKGAGSVVNGHESMAGQINIELKKPFGKNNFLLDQFVSEGGRAETDLLYRKDINKYLATSILARYSFQSIENDRNEDGFLDNPTGNQFQVMNRWQFTSEKGYEGIASVSYNQDEKNAGQKAYYHGNENAYGVGLNTTQFDAIAKIGKSFKDKPYKSFGSQFAYNKTNFDGSYGNSESPNIYNGESSTLYANLLYQSIIKNTFHQFQTGISLVSDEISETYKSFEFSRTETVPGAFFEYTYKPKETFSLVGGIRTDYNLIYGWSVTPRFHSKYRFNKEKTSLRVSSGLGRRTSNPLAQSQQIFTSSRSVQFLVDDLSLPYGLEQEVSLNSGFSFEHKMKLVYIPTTIGIDFFNTTFINEVVIDREEAGSAKFYNMKDGTRANSFQAQLDLVPARRTEIRIAYRMFDVQTKYKELGYLDKPFISKHRSFINLTQRTRNHWQFSSTGTWYGPQRIAGTEMEVQNGQNSYSREESPSFVLLNAQISKTFKKQFELYLGAENILNYRQENPIEGAANPFGSDFDAGLVWGPVFGRMIYGGFRWRINGAEAN
jgi:outer membrane receptor for ferrienterochelin and colicins